MANEGLAPAEADTPEYGPVCGVLTPQANTTVEPEMQALLTGTVLTARCMSPSQDSRQRLLDYFDGLGATLARFDTAPVRVAGFACTGSSYLVGRQREDSGIAACAAERGFEVVSATQAIRECLDLLGVRRLALVSPYPGWLSAAAQAYWQEAGYALTDVAGLPADLVDTRHIYRLTSSRVMDVLASLRTDGCDAVLLSGTGMPTLRALSSHQQQPGMPWLVSSNLCLAWAMLARMHPAMRDRDALLRFIGPGAPWRAQLAMRRDTF
ncbi:MAG: hypothetical protein JWQ72_2849 [Polaromonas sp.]|nr:hypothetical protein [Polaromonas sp.]